MAEGRIISKTSCPLPFFGQTIPGYPDFRGCLASIKLLLAEKENQIRRLDNMVMTALERSSFSANNYNNQGRF